MYVCDGEPNAASESRTGIVTRRDLGGMWCASTRAVVTMREAGHLRRRYARFMTNKARLCAAWLPRSLKPMRDRTKSEVNLLLLAEGALAIKNDNCYLDRQSLQGVSS